MPSPGRLLQEHYSELSQGQFAFFVALRGFNTTTTKQIHKSLYIPCSTLTEDGVQKSSGHFLLCQFMGILAPVFRAFHKESSR